MKTLLAVFITCLISSLANAEDIKCYNDHHKPITFQSYYAQFNRRSVPQGHSLWGGAPETPNDTQMEVFERLANTVAAYENCLHGIRK